MNIGNLKSRNRIRGTWLGRVSGCLLGKPSKSCLSSKGAAVGGLIGLSDASIDSRWTAPWQGRLGVSLAGIAELSVEELMERTHSVADGLCR
ncbi:MAG: hypothetical protein QNJ14_00735 [Woeseiaceae bacterium]|nr:hypothetical protein [Woeseiaceae bacterium]